MPAHVPRSGSARRSVSRLVPVLAMGLALALGLAGCGGGSTGNAGAAASDSAAPASRQTLDITVDGDDVKPANKRVAVDLSEPLTLRITSDRAGELHVHSSPEQHVEFKTGTTTKKIRFTVPGVIELEEHESDSLIAQLEVR